MFENQFQRLWVTIAGIYYEVAVCSVAFSLVVSYPDTLLNQLGYKTMLFTGISAVFFNINPLIRSTGITRSRAFSRSRTSEKPPGNNRRMFQKKTPEASGGDST